MNATDFVARRPKRSLAATVNTVYPGGGERVRVKFPSASVKAGLSLIVRNEMLCAVPTSVTVVDDVALP